MTTQTKTTWRTVRLGDVATLHRGYDLPIERMRKGTYPVIFSNGKIEHHDEYKIEGPGVVTGRSGTLGNIFYLSEDFWPHNTTLYVSDFHGNYPHFIYYMFKRLDLAHLNAGSGVPTLNRNHVHEILVKVPDDRGEQTRIAEILSAFDDKIENNSRIIKTLEEMAQAIFKELFVNRNVEQKGVPLTDLAKFINGGAFGKIVNRKREGLPLIKIAEFTRGITENTDWVNKDVADKYRVKNGDLLFSWSGTVGLHIWDKDNAVLNQHIFNVIPNAPYSMGFLYIVLRYIMPVFIQIAGSKATTMGHIQKKHLEEQVINIPSGADLGIFDTVYQKIVIAKIENQKLAAMRDFLLPRLMSGEIRVKYL